MLFHDIWEMHLVGQSKFMHARKRVVGSKYSIHTLLSCDSVFLVAQCLVQTKRFFCPLVVGLELAKLCIPEGFVPRQAADFKRRS